MLPSLGPFEFLVIAIIALIVVGPEDLPKLAKQVGGFMSRIRSLGREFKSAFDEMGEATEMAELKKEIEELKKMGKLENLSDDAFAEDMRSLDRDIRDAVDLDNPISPADNTPETGKGE